jgi:phosphoribosylaminoimidazole (AIR) synthetase
MKTFGPAVDLMTAIAAIDVAALGCAAVRRSTWHERRREGLAVVGIGSVGLHPND